MLNQTLTDSDLLRLIQAQVDALREESGGAPVVIGKSSTLGADLGLSSLGLAQLITALSLKTGVDPFQQLVPITSVRIVGDLVDAYRAISSADPSSCVAAPDSALVDSQRRASLRRGSRSSHE